eukprot:SAG31_NODE_6604_length_1955_cov_1.174569_4_plen_139_part_00
MESNGASTIQNNAAFVEIHKSELTMAANAFWMTGVAFLMRGLARFVYEYGAKRLAIGQLLGYIDSLAFGLFMLHAHSKLQYLLRGYTVRSSADEMCKAVVAVGECLRYFCFVVIFQPNDGVLVTVIGLAVQLSGRFGA